MKRLVRAFYRVRYFPRLLVQLMTSVSASQGEVRRHVEAGQRRLDARLAQLDAVQRAGAASLDDLRTEVSAMCDGTARSLMAGETEAADLGRRVDAVARHVLQLGALMEAQMREIRAAVQGQLDHVATRAADADAAIDRGLKAVTEAIGRQEAEVARMDRRAGMQARLLPTNMWPPEDGERVRAVLALLRPVGVAGVGRIRIGRDHDGGYVMLDDFAGIGAALSLGIADDVSWDTDIADRGIDVLQFDPSVPGPPALHDRFRFERLRIEAHDRPGAVSLATVVAERLRPDAGALLLKMDIEGAEWDVLDTADDALLGRFRQIACEFHDLDRLAEPEFGARAQRVFARLARTHLVVHVHGNNCGTFANVGNVVVPQSLEVTFVLRGAYRPTAEALSFPTPLDRPNEPGRADLFLGAFRFDVPAAASVTPIALAS